MADERSTTGRTGPAVEGSTAGRLLVATPILRDPNFHRTVLLMLEHHEEGALGIVLNRMVDQPVVDLLPVWGPFLAAPGRVFVGGPVQPETAIGIGYRPDSTSDPTWPSVLDGVGLVDLGKEPEEFPDLERLRVFAGYAGWGPGQLEFELAAGSWFVLDGHLGDVFTPKPESLWEEVVGRQRSRVRLYLHHPVDPRMN